MPRLDSDVRPRSGECRAARHNCRSAHCGSVPICTGGSQPQCSCSDGAQRPMSADSRRSVLLALCLAGSAALIVGGSLAPEQSHGSGPAGVATARAVAARPIAPPTTSPAVSTTQPPVIPASFWTDYVLIDSVVD